jgi:hypothetical protein
MVHHWMPRRSCAAQRSLRLTLPLVTECSRKIGLVEGVGRDGEAWLHSASSANSWLYHERQWR